MLCSAFGLLEWLELHSGVQTAVIMTILHDSFGCLQAVKERGSATSYLRVFYSPSQTTSKMAFPQLSREGCYDMQKEFHSSTCPIEYHAVRHAYRVQSSAYD